MSHPAWKFKATRYRPANLAHVILVLVFGATHPFAHAHEPENDRESDGKATSVGCPLAPGIVVLLEREIRNSLEKRGIQSSYARFRAYAARELESTQDETYAEMSGIGRLCWYRHLWENPVSAPVKTEAFTRKLYQALLNGGVFDGVLGVAAVKLDLDAPAQESYGASDPADDPFEVLRLSLERARDAHNAVLLPLTQDEREELERGLYRVFTENEDTGHTLSNSDAGRDFVRLLAKADRGSWMKAAAALAPLTEPEWLQQLQNVSSEDLGEVQEVVGDVVRRFHTEAGDVIVGGATDNTYYLDKLNDVCAVIDLGGEDEYRQGSVSSDRPVLVVIDLAGDDPYVATNPGVQGGAVLGVSMLLDLQGNDVYRARDVAQGSCLGGVGILSDHSGDDVYIAVRRVQGHAVAGLGVLADRAGNDRYYAAMWGQGLGGPLGFGLLDDLEGKDLYCAGGLYLDSYSESPGYEGWSQGVGAGLRSVANGGIGVILDGGGDDVYEFDYMGHGGGYWLGVGMARDFGGNDRRLGATRKAFAGKKRTQRRFQRFGNGFGCHNALGFCFDDAGNDTYDGTIMGIGFAWDMSVGVLCDFDGDDQYNADGDYTQGNGAQASLGILFDYHGNDVYRGQEQGYAPSYISYHNSRACGGNFSYVIDYGGEDEYGCGARNRSYLRRGSDGGFLIDRPQRKEDAPAKRLASAKPGNQAAETGSGPSQDKEP